MKLFVVFFAFLAVQGWTSARVISDDSLEDVIPDDILDLIDSSDLELFGDLPQEIFDEFAGEETAADPKNCLPHIQDAYNNAVEVRRIIGQARALGKKLRDAAKKCKAQTKPDDKKKCYQELRKQAVAEGKPIKDAYLKVRPKVIDVMGKFDKCMARQTKEIDSQANPQNCLPHVQEAYDTAVEVRRIIGKARELGQKLRDGFKKCKTQTKPEDKKKCYRDLRKQAVHEGKPIKDAYLKIRPKVIEVMAKFDKCMA